MQKIIYLILILVINIVIAGIISILLFCLIFGLAPEKTLITFVGQGVIVIVLSWVFAQLTSAVSALFVQTFNWNKRHIARIFWAQLALFQIGYLIGVMVILVS